MVKQDKFILLELFEWGIVLIRDTYLRSDLMQLIRVCCVLPKAPFPAEQSFRYIPQLEPMRGNVGRQIKMKLIKRIRRKLQYETRMQQVVQ